MAVSATSGALVAGAATAVVGTSVHFLERCGPPEAVCLPFLRKHCCGRLPCGRHKQPNESDAAGLRNSTTTAMPPPANKSNQAKPPTIPTRKGAVSDPSGLKQRGNVRSDGAQNNAQSKAGGIYSTITPSVASDDHDNASSTTEVSQQPQSWLERAYRKQPDAFSKHVAVTESNEVLYTARKSGYDGATAGRVRSESGRKCDEFLVAKRDTQTTGNTRVPESSPTSFFDGSSPRSMQSHRNELGVVSAQRIEHIAQEFAKNVNFSLQGCMELVRVHASSRDYACCLAAAMAASRVGGVEGGQTAWATLFRAVDGEEAMDPFIVQEMVRQMVAHGYVLGRRARKTAQSKLSAPRFEKLLEELQQAGYVIEMQP
eukprot:TRINITY_DN50031_c0_g1_i1.p1 TRINITY_DN50031_c0_g1~~TRINITY_DN50031_c0_g1_i1.p1  ORF type:complete len:372 (+),score=57.53 TRINITY_DN50031_c0_g1_i1:87-1202(+)